MPGDLLYDRRCTLTVGPPGGTGVAIDQLRVAFDVRKTIGSATNKARVSVWGLAETTRGAMRERHDEVRLEAGYDGLVEELYRGELTRAAHPRSGPEIITMLECGDGTEAYKAAQVTKTWSRGTPVPDVIRAVARRFTEPIEEDADEPLAWGPKPKRTKPARIALRGLDADLAALVADLGVQGIAAVLRRPLSVNASAKDVMDALGRTYRFDWSVQDGVLQVVSYGRALAGEIVSLSPDSGLLGDPTPTETGVKLVALLIPRLRPGVALDLDSRVLKGRYRIESATYAGDTHGDQWQVEIEGRALPGLV